jgi:hypothetical protein
VNLETMTEALTRDIRPVIDTAALDDRMTGAASTMAHALIRTPPTAAPPPGRASSLEANTRLSQTTAMPEAAPMRLLFRF